MRNQVFTPEMSRNPKSVHRLHLPTASHYGRHSQLPLVLVVYVGLLFICPGFQTYVSFPGIFTRLARHQRNFWPPERLSPRLQLVGIAQVFHSLPRSDGVTSPKPTSSNRGFLPRNFSRLPKWEVCQFAVQPQETRLRIYGSSLFVSHLWCDLLLLARGLETWSQKPPDPVELPTKS